jgi:chromosome segregation ATPase
VRPAPEIVALYRELAIRAGVAEASSWEVPAARSDVLVSRDALQARHVSRNLHALRRSTPDSPFAPAEETRLRRLRRENDQITNALRYFEGRIEELKREVAHARAERDWQAADRDHVAALLESRSEELQAAVASLAGLRSQLDDALNRAGAAESSLAAVDKSRLVRLQRRYWRMLSGLRRR